ncbi:hypothetical protein QWZ03_05865 [Chitinimonas viridis]|uniref:FeoB-associated Cys-rich membrane protein n=1 Tax=Chitinimonas viridis TaxID=664880 RepID=A0ABT8B2D5_9NEIS|nr:hypothetical protein [Chitinimonas viridis]MDN3576288.1 hypothetical protein [Chitinimonas viridis]
MAGLLLLGVALGVGWLAWRVDPCLRCSYRRQGGCAAADTCAKAPSVGRLHTVVVHRR